MRIVYLCRSTSNRFMVLTISEFTRRWDGTCERWEMLVRVEKGEQRGERMSEMNEREKKKEDRRNKLWKQRREKEERNLRENVQE